MYAKTFYLIFFLSLFFALFHVFVKFCWFNYRETGPTKKNWDEFNDFNHVNVPQVSENDCDKFSFFFDFFNHKPRDIVTASYPLHRNLDIVYAFQIDRMKINKNCIRSRLTPRVLFRSKNKFHNLFIIN